MHISVSKAVFFNLFAAAEPYVSVTITHGTPCIYPMIRKSSDVGEVQFSGCLETDVPSRVKEAENLREPGIKPSNAADKAAGKRLVQFHRISVILFSNFISCVTNNTL